MSGKLELGHNLAVATMMSRIQTVIVLTVLIGCDGLSSSYGVYQLVEVDRHQVPAVLPHGPGCEIRVDSGSIELREGGFDVFLDWRVTCGDHLIEMPKEWRGDYLQPHGKLIGFSRVQRANGARRSSGTRIVPVVIDNDAIAFLDPYTDPKLLLKFER